MTKQKAEQQSRELEPQSRHPKNQVLRTHLIVLVLRPIKSYGQS